MAKQKSFIKIQGSLGGLTFYQKNGKDIIRTTGGIDKDRIERDPAFKQTRENMKEFGGSATVGKALRMGYGPILKRVSDNTVVPRITGVMKRINSFGSGTRGQRNFEIVNHSGFLENFEFNNSLPLSSIFYAAYELPVVDNNRNTITWVVPDFDTDSFITEGVGATHCQLVLAATVLSDYRFNRAQNLYEAMHPAENETHGIAYSREITLGGTVGEDTTFFIDLGLAKALPRTAGVVIAIGILFYQQINTRFYELGGANAMKIVRVT